MITVTGLELRAGARILLSETTLRVQPGDRIGLVGRNGAGKTTTLKVMAGEGLPYAGQVERRGEAGYLPQDPRTGDLDVTARDRVLSARGLDTLLHDMEKVQVGMAEAATEADRDKLVRKYGRLEDQFAALGGYAAESDAARICANLNLPSRSARSQAASAAASSWPGFFSPTPRRSCSTSRPTTSTPTRSPGCATTSGATSAASS
jgi:ATPase subunit of ABC transporter with duplicated ATPase domains